MAADGVDLQAELDKAKRQLGKMEELAAAADAVRARARAEELERLVAFSQALANVLDLASISTMRRSRAATSSERISPDASGK